MQKRIYMKACIAISVVMCGESDSDGERSLPVLQPDRSEGLPYSWAGPGFGGQLLMGLTDEGGRFVLDGDGRPIYTPVTKEKTRLRQRFDVYFADSRWADLSPEDGFIPPSMPAPPNPDPMSIPLNPTPDLVQNFAPGAALLDTVIDLNATVGGFNNITINLPDFVNPPQNNPLVPDAANPPQADAVAPDVADLPQIDPIASDDPTVSPTVPIFEPELVTLMKIVSSKPFMIIQWFVSLLTQSIVLNRIYKQRLAYSSKANFINYCRNWTSSKEFNIFKRVLPLSMLPSVLLYATRRKKLHMQDFVVMQRLIEILSNSIVLEVYRNHLFDPSFQKILLILSGIWNLRFLYLFNASNPRS